MVTPYAQEPVRMPRLLALPLIAACAALALPSSAAAEEVTCYPPKHLSYVGVCAGIIPCEDLCGGPEIVVDPYCELDRPQLKACQVIDAIGG